MVTCKQCDRHYRCTPEADYYNATTNSDGVCEPCLIGDLPLVVENACQAGRTIRGSAESWDTPCMTPGQHRILLINDDKIPGAILWFCDRHFGWLRARTPMQWLPAT